MLVKKQEPPSTYEFIDAYHTMLLWCSDGWVYDTKNRTRKKFFLTDDGLFHMEEEPYARDSYSDVQHTENVKIFVLSESPKIWIEQNDWGADMFTEM